MGEEDDERTERRAGESGKERRRGGLHLHVEPRRLGDGRGVVRRLRRDDVGGRICSSAIDLAPCGLDKHGDGGPYNPCDLEVVTDDLNQAPPVDATFVVRDAVSKYSPIESVAWQFDKSSIGSGSMRGNRFTAHFGPADGGHRSVKITATVLGGTVCKFTHHFYVNPQPTIALTASAVDGHPLRVALHATGTVDDKPWTGFNWDFGGGTPVSCSVWRDDPDVIVDFPSAGTYQVTVYLTAVGYPASETITVQVGEQEPRPEWIFPGAQPRARRATSPRRWLKEARCPRPPSARPPPRRKRSRESLPWTRLWCPTTATSRVQHVASDPGSSRCSRSRLRAACRRPDPTRSGVSPLTELELSRLAPAVQL